MNINIDNGADYNEKGVTPNIGMPAEDEAESTTKATVSEGEIEIRDKENKKQDIAGLNRDTQNSLNKLGEIFDKDSIEERQELAGLFGELAVKNGWKEGSTEKNALHAFVGGIMAELGGSDFTSGASGALINEMVQEKLGEVFEDDPAMHQWASTLIGGVVSEIVSGNAQAGASTAASGTKHNILSHEQYEQKKEGTEGFDNPLAGGTIGANALYWYQVDREQQTKLVEKLKDPDFVARLDEALAQNPYLTEFEGVIIKGYDFNGNVVDATNPINRQQIIDGEDFSKNFVNYINKINLDNLSTISTAATKTIEDGKGNIQNLKNSPFYKMLKSTNAAIDVICVGNIIYTDIQDFSNKDDLTIAIAYDALEYGATTAGGAIGGTVFGLASGGHPCAIAVGVVAGSKLAEWVASDWIDTRKAQLKNK